MWAYHVEWRFEFIFTVTHQRFVHRYIRHFDSLLHVLKLNFSAPFLNCLLSLFRLLPAASDRLDHFLGENQADLGLARNLELQLPVVVGWDHP